MDRDRPMSGNPTKPVGHSAETMRTEASGRIRSRLYEPAKLKVISIIGAGHSGSTLLDIVLGSHPNVEAVGELHKLPRSGWTRNDDRRCACGSPIHECEFWTKVYRRWTNRVGGDHLARYIAMQEAFEGSRKRWPRLLIERRWRSSRFTVYADMTTALYEAIRDVSGKSVIVDSSKRAIRTYALLSNPGLDVRVIHLVRDGRGVVWSKLKTLDRDIDAGVPEDRSPIRPRRATLQWVFSNLESGWVADRTGERAKTLRITYESLVETPSVVLRDVSTVVEEDLGAVADALAGGNTMDVGHTVGGNRMRLSRSVSLRPDFEWKQKLLPRDRRTFWRHGGWLARRYGYTR